MVEVQWGVVAKKVCWEGKQFRSTKDFFVELGSGDEKEVRTARLILICRYSCTCKNRRAHAADCRTRGTRSSFMHARAGWLGSFKYMPYKTTVRTHDQNQ